MNQDYIILSLATRPGTWIREKLSPSRMISEWLISDYKEKMNILREVDDTIYKWTEDLDDMVKEMKKALSAGRYLDLFTLLYNLNQKLLSVKDLGEKIKEVQEEALKEFEKKHYEYLPNINLETLQPIKQAGISDWARKVVVEKFLDKTRIERNIKLNWLIGKANTTVQTVQNLVKDLGTFRNKGEIGKYIDILNKISIEQQNFYKNFLPIYSTYLKPLVEEVLSINKQTQTSKTIDESKPITIDPTKSVQNIPELPELEIAPKSESPKEEIDTVKKPKPKSKLKQKESPEEEGIFSKIPKIF